MIQKLPRHGELARQGRRQRLDPESFRRVVAAVKDVHPQFLRQRKRPMRPLAGDERVHAFARRQFQFRAGSAGDDPDAPLNLAGMIGRNGYHLRQTVSSKPL